MRQNLTQIAFSGLLVLSFSIIGTPTNANALGSIASATANMVERSAVVAPLVQVDRRDRRKKRRRPPPRAGIYFEFGRPATRPARPHYNRPVRLSRAHVRWCNQRYRSYRASDNTFQPYNGPRRPCRSPYSR